MPDDKHTNVTTKLYVEHACNFVQTNQLAVLLGLNASRISEMKKGLRKLTIAEGEIIRGEFGLPEMSQGIYIEAELLESNWLDDFLKNGEMLLRHNILRYASSSSFMDFLLGSFNIDTQYIEGYEHELSQYSDDERKGREHRNKRLEENKKLELINQLMASSDFNRWYNDNIQVKSSSNSQINKELDYKEKESLSAITHHIEEGFFISNDEMLPKVRFIVSTYRLIQQLAEDGSSGHGCSIVFGQKKGLSDVPNPIREYVINGREVWSSGQICELVESVTQHENVNFPPDIKYPKEVSRLNLTQEKLRYVNFALIYTEKHDYYVKVILHKCELPDVGDRTLLIKIQERINLFGELNSIFEVFQARCNVEEFYIKEKLAKNGAYIPTAIYLN
ncbi:hypothetical protein [Vibrio vulnificus]|uniref:hypothetical protein n=1 Tax=Vibrio vulnificus TaxID=672 RepID=UPI001CCD672A|nr:hypothetical protein [Vibrio vulnificus]MCA0762514.1 hypothetical protein [Vibrio vulnificus]